MSDDLNTLDYWRKRAFTAEEELRHREPRKPPMPKGCQVVLLMVLLAAWILFACEMYVYFKHEREHRPAPPKSAHESSTT